MFNYSGRIVSIERLTNSRNGNPRFRITLQSSSMNGSSRMHTWNTAADHAFNYEIGNPGMRVESQVLVTVGGRGTITGISPR